MTPLPRESFAWGDWPFLYLSNGDRLIKHMHHWDFGGKIGAGFLIDLNLKIGFKSANWH